MHLCKAVEASRVVSKHAGGGRPLANAGPSDVPQLDTSELPRRLLRTNAKNTTIAAQAHAGARPLDASNFHVVDSLERPAHAP